MTQLFYLYAKLRAFLVKMASLQAEYLSRFRHVAVRAFQFGKNRRPFEGFNPGKEGPRTIGRPAWGGRGSPGQCLCHQTVVDFAISQEQEPLDGIPQFADVAGPWIPF